MPPRGVLFLDDLPSLRADVVQALRQHVRKPTLRLYQGPELPCDAHLAASIRPCLCGLLGHPARVCTCTPRQVAREEARVPRGMFPIRVRLPFPAGNALELDRSPTSAVLRERVTEARTKLAEAAASGSNQSHDGTGWNGVLQCQRVAFRRHRCLGGHPSRIEATTTCHASSCLCWRTVGASS
ncbi:MAG: ATP-binding protein [Myxococcales bacterium]|nr:ATP-binding protein [Myxococcales bacterium]